MDEGQPAGSCGCSRDADCGDGGLACLPGSFDGTVSAGFCGVPCTAPDFPSCVSFLQGAVCDPLTGLCSPCTVDSQCAQDPHSGGPHCGNGQCGCLSDPDCSAGWSCEAPGPSYASQFSSLGVCTPAMSRCTPSACGGYFCNWQDGSCANNVDVGTVPSCLDDYDCGSPGFCTSGGCAECRTDADCRVISQAGLDARSATYCFQGDPACPNGNRCMETCASDADCAGNPNGTGCVSENSTTECGCNSDQDCAGVAHAPHCYLPSAGAAGTCECSVNADCSPGEACQVEVGGNTVCTNTCTVDSDCASGFFCHPRGFCQPRCDPGHRCLSPDPVCDVGNLFGDNGTPDGGAVWCYECILGDDCDGGLGCDTFFYPPFCRHASANGSAPAAAAPVCPMVCATRPAPQGPCPDGQVCDTLGLAGNGTNVCYGCVTAADCRNGEGCDHATHMCGTCEGPSAAGAPSDCPPGAVCSNYWGGQSGACLPNCDRAPCLENRPRCETFPSLRRSRSRVLLRLSPGLGLLRRRPRRLVRHLGGSDVHVPASALRHVPMGLLTLSAHARGCHETDRSRSSRLGGGVTEITFPHGARGRWISTSLPRASAGTPRASPPRTPGACPEGDPRPWTGGCRGRLQPRSGRRRDCGCAE